jgi:hypothetical protein
MCVHIHTEINTLTRVKKNPSSWKSLLYGPMGNEYWSFLSVSKSVCVCVCVHIYQLMLI